MILKRSAQGAVLLAGMLALGGCSPLVGAASVAGLTTAQKRAPVDALLDTQLELRVNGALFAVDEPTFTSLSTEVVEGHVLLTGTLPDTASRVRAVETVWSVPGVRRVSDEITVGEGGDPLDALDDMRISSELRGRLLMDPDVRSLNFNIETENGTVHLMGLAADTDELTRVTELAATVPGVTRVVSHVYLYDDPRRRLVEEPAAP